MFFAGKDYCVPNNAHNILIETYGLDYMTPPPLEKRKTHHAIKIDFGPYDAYIIQKEAKQSEKIH